MYISTVLAESISTYISTCINFNVAMCRLVHVYVLILFLRFLNYLENEIYNSNSPIWHADFNQTPEALAVPSPAGSSKTPTPSPAAGPASNISKIGK
jgi:hypothetical protein